MFFTSDQEPGVQLPVFVVYDISTGAVMAMQSTKDSSVETVAAVAQTPETWDTDVVLHADGEPTTKSPECIGLYRGVVCPNPGTSRSVHPGFPRDLVANKLALEAGIGCRLLLKDPVIVWLIRRIAWFMTRCNAGRDGCPFWRIFGRPYDGSICKFGGALQAEWSSSESCRTALGLG